MKHMHWDFAQWHWQDVKKFDSADITTFAIMGAVFALILLMIVGLFFSTPPTQSDILTFPGV